MAEIRAVFPGIFVYSVVWFMIRRTMKKFKAQGLYLMLESPRKFAVAVDVYMFISIVWLGFESEYLSTDFWQVFEFVLLCVVCYLFVPSKDYGMNPNLTDGKRKEENVNDADCRPSGMFRCSCFVVLANTIHLACVIGECCQ